ncbi:MAG: DUF6382 domain-containing protein [Clostridia bacterium]|nr:DUF6382 domain-containing protein [Clostridia bacterium]
MSNTVTERFSFSFENSAAASYLVVTASSTEKVQHFQVEMIANNPNPGILPLDVRQKDDKINFYCNITSKLALSQFLKRKKLSRNEFINIIDGIVSPLLECRNYLLNDKSFLINEDYIYINPSSLEVSLAYIPIMLETDIVQVFKDFLIKLIVYTANIDEGASDNFVQRILSYVKTDTFNLIDFDKLLKELKSGQTVAPVFSQPLQAANISNMQSDSPAVGITQMPQPRSASAPTMPTPEPVRQEVKATPPRPANSKIPPAIPGQQNKNIPTSPKPQTAAPVKQTQAAPQGSKSNPKLIAILLVILQLVAVGVLISSGVINLSGEDGITTIAGLGLILLAVNFLVFKKLLAASGTSDDSVKPELKKAPAAPPQKPLDMSKREIRNIPNRQDKVAGAPQPQVVQTPIVQAPSAPPSIPAFNDSTTILSPIGNSDETTLLGFGAKKQPYLQGKRDGMLEEISIAKPSFLIGRLRDQVDYVCQNNAVGKIHAELITSNGMYYVKDLNSRNGTYINGSKIESNKEYPIKNGDKITFANSEYSFIVPEE